VGGSHQKWAPTAWIRSMRCTHVLTHTHTHSLVPSQSVGWFFHSNAPTRTLPAQTDETRQHIHTSRGGGGGGASHRSALEDHKLQVRRIYLSTADRTASQTGTQQAGRPLTQYKEGGRQMCVGWFTSRQRDRWMDGWSDAVMPSVCIMYACMHVCVCMYVCMR